jgi:tRNA threonylcarbamoyladenosine biosynthesis protein TsaB
MLSLASLVASHSSVLVLDAATTRSQAGLLRAGAPPVWHAGEGDSGVQLFVAADACLAAAGLRPSAVSAYVFCDGPGSQLGIRTACMALRTWQTLRAAPAPVFAYRSLVVAALVHARTTPAPFAVIADARRESWHAVRVATDGALSEVLRVPNDELRTWPEPLVQPAGFRAWSSPPRPAGTCNYDCSVMFTALAAEPLLFPVPAPEPWASAPVAYKAWTGERHRGAAG